MPHIVVEYSRQLEKDVKLDDVLQALHADLIERETIGSADLKTYALPISECIVGLPETQDAMVHVILKLLPGRPVELKREMVAGLKSVVSSFVQGYSITVEIQELESETYCK